MSDLVNSRANLIKMLETLWDYAADPQVPSAKSEFIQRWANDFIERFDIQFPLPDLGIHIEEEVEADERLNPAPTKEELEQQLAALNPKDVRAIEIRKLLDDHFKDQN